MNTLPDPLHPAVVHFPIVLVLAAAVLAVVALGVRRMGVQVLTALTLALATASAIAVAQTGESEEHRVKGADAATRQMFEAHEQWADRGQGLIFLAALTGITATVLAYRRLRRSPSPEPASPVLGAAAPGGGLLLTLRGITAAAALAAAWCVYESGHTGGKLVYEKGVGVRSAQP